MQHEYDKDYENFFCYNGYDERYARIYQKCKGIVERIEGTSSVISQTADNLKRKFSSEYMTQQIELMVSMQATNPTNAIGTAKELIESCKFIAVKYTSNRSGSRCDKSHIRKFEGYSIKTGRNKESFWKWAWKKCIF